MEVGIEEAPEEVAASGAPGEAPEIPTDVGTAVERTIAAQIAVEATVAAAAVAVVLEKAAMRAGQQFRACYAGVLWSLAKRRARSSYRREDMHISLASSFVVWISHSPLCELLPPRPRLLPRPDRMCLYGQVPLCP